MMINSNPDRYHEENKMRVPTPNLKSLEPKKCEKENEVCSICCDEIKKNDIIIEIPNCLHKFHYNGKNCLSDDFTILKWLKENKKCPTCNTEVIIN